MHTLLMPVTADNVNILPTPHAYGLPSSTAITGFGHAAIRLINTMLNLSLVDHGVAIAIDTYNVKEGRPRHVIASRDSRSSAAGGKMSSLVDERLAHIDMYLLVRFECDQSQLAVVQNHLALIESQIGQLGFSGGSLQGRGAFEVIENDHSGQLSLERLPFDARVLVDKTRLIKAASDLFGEDSFDATVRLLNKSSEQRKDFQGTSEKITLLIEKDEEELTKEDQLDRQYLGHLLALNVGYRAIEEPTTRKTRKSDLYLHIYAEPVTGICRLQSAASLLVAKDEMQKTESIFWKHRAKQPYYVSLETITHE
jgi:CRISPR type I-F-associated protein Csy2